MTRPPLYTSTTKVNHLILMLLRLVGIHKEGSLGSFIRVFFAFTGEQTRKQPWNPHAQGNSQTTHVHSDVSLPTTMKTPQSAHEFSKVWRRPCKTEKEKYELLLKIGGQELGRIFKAEISMGFLGEFLSSLLNYLNVNDAKAVCDILLQLSKTNRFDLSLKFLGEEERKITSELIKRLEEVNLEDDMENKCKVTKNVEILQELRKIYGVPTEIAS